MMRPTVAMRAERSREPARGLNLAVSNIAWGEADDADVAAVIAGLGAGGVEIAPTRRWSSPPDATAEEIAEYRARWESRGLPIVALQALLFGRPELRIFDDDATRDRTLDYLAVVLRLGAGLGAHAFVFGSPANRQVGGRDRAEAEAIAARFFAAAGRVAADEGVQLCIEPNPPAYKCDFLTNTREAIAFLERVDAPGLGLHLDAGALTLNGEDVEEAVAAAGPWLRHFHVSEPNLAPIGSGGADHRRIAAALRRAGYDGWLSIEMRAAADSPAAEHVRGALELTLREYESVLTPR